VKVPVLVVTAPVPPQVDDAADAAPAVLAVSPPAARPAASTSPAIFLDRTINPTLPSAADYWTKGNLPVGQAKGEISLWIG
jgi:hypothetical protein